MAEDYTKSEFYKVQLGGSGSTGLLTLYSNLCMVVVHYTHQHMLCFVAIVDSTHVNHIVHFKNQHMPVLLLTVST